MAIGALRAIHDMNIQVPDDIAFICNGSLHQYDLLHDSAITELVTVCIPKQKGPEEKGAGKAGESPVNQRVPGMDGSKRKK